MRHQDRRQRAPAREAEGRDAPGLAGGPAVGAQRRIVCLGDSTTRGWPPTLRALLGKKAEVLNGVVEIDGEGTAGDVINTFIDAGFGIKTVTDPPPAANTPAELLPNADGRSFICFLFFELESR